MNNHSTSLNRRINGSFLVVVALLAAVIVFHSYLTLALMESRYWQIILESTLADLEAKSAGSDRRHQAHVGPLHAWRIPSEDSEEFVPEVFQALPPGFGNEEIKWQGREYVALVQQTGDERVILALDITELETQQNRGAQLGALFALVGVLLAALVVRSLARRLSAPVKDIADRMASLDPRQPGARLPTDYKEVEIVRIADAANGYLDRVDRFIERERILIDQASHEFRTPIAVIASATDVLNTLPDLPASAHRPLHRIGETIDNLHEIMAALLYLSREQQPDDDDQEWCDLRQAIPAIIADHQHLLDGKPVAFKLTPFSPVILGAPEAMVRIAVSNLLRNAAENTHNGGIDVSVETTAGVVLHVIDTGVGFDPEQVARAYTRSLRAGPTPGTGQGLGLFLIQRICERFGWTLTLEPIPDGGTRASLDLSASVVPPS